MEGSRPAAAAAAAAFKVAVVSAATVLQDAVRPTQHHTSERELLRRHHTTYSALQQTPAVMHPVLHDKMEEAKKCIFINLSDGKKIIYYIVSVQNIVTQVIVITVTSCRVHLFSLP